MKYFKNKKVLVYCAGLLLIAAMGIRFVLSVGALPKYDYDIEDWRCENVVYTDQGITVDDSLKDSGTIREFLWGPFKPLKKGSYTALINYSSEYDQQVSAAGTDLSDCSTGIMSRHLNTIDYQFEILEDTDAFDLIIWYNGTGSFSVKSISITANNRAIKRTTTEIIFAVILFELLFYLYDKKKQIFRTFCLILGITAVSALPLASYGIHNGPDIQTHLLRIEAIFQALRFGQFPARISSITLFGLGYPFSIYYNDLFLYFPAFLRLLGFSVNTAYKIYVFVVLFLTAAIAYLSFGKIFNNRKNGLILSLLYTTASYHYTNVYTRAAVGEYTAQAFLPLLALAFYRIYTNESRKEIGVNALLLAVGMSEVIGSHILTTIMACFLMLIVCILLWKRTFTKNVLSSFLLAVVMTVILNLYFLVPFVDYYFNVPTVIKGSVDHGRTMIQEMGVHPVQLFTFFQKVVGTWDTTGQERMQANPGLPLMSILLIALFRKFTVGKCRNSFHLYLVLSLFVLFLSTNVFPWNWLSYRISFWSMLSQIQFPVRFLVFAILFLTLLGGEILSEYESIYLRAGFICTAVLMSLWFAGNLLDNDQVFYIYDTSGVDPCKTGYEYYLQGSDWNKTSTKIETENMNHVKIVSKESNILHLYCKADQNNQPHKVFVPVYNYKGYYVTDDEGHEYGIINGEQNHLGFELPDDFSGMITVDFRDPILWRAALFISIITAVFIAAIICIRSRYFRKTA